MKKIKILWLALFAVFAFSAVATTSAAFAEESQILANGATILALLPLEVTGSLLLEDMNATGTPDILCSGAFDGMIEPGGTLGYVEEVLTSGKELLEGELGGDLVECVDDKNVCSSPVDVEALELPWHWQIILHEPLPGVFAWLLHFLNLLEIEELKEVGVGVPTYHIDCNTLIGLVEDLCEGLSSARLWVDLMGHLRGSFNSLLLDESEWGAESEATDCIIGGMGQGLIESPEDEETSGGIFSDPSDNATLTLT